MKAPLLKILQVAGKPYKHKRASDEMNYSHLLPTFLDGFKPLLKPNFLPSHIKKDDLSYLNEDPEEIQARNNLVDEEIKVALM
jgi:hypothetical protein